jgi:glucosamine--fructose-6-phosphate aminotransferase (isomerizing)
MIFWWSDVCGIFGYCGSRDAAPVIVEGLRKLEYRGYDSYGFAVLGNGIAIHKKEGRIPKDFRISGTFGGSIGIGHTRWATHGVPNDINAHPHGDCNGNIFVVHNGIIENYAKLKRRLVAEGHCFRSDTDTEVIPHLVESSYQGDLQKAVESVLRELEGSYALLALSKDENRIVAARKSSPMVLGIGDREYFVASDMTPILDYTANVVFLEDGDLVSITPAGTEVYHDGWPVDREIQRIEWSVEDVKKGGFRHYMIKEIFEQPEVFSSTLRGLHQEEMSDFIRKCQEILVVACGTSYHAAMVFRYLMEEQCHVPVRVDLASEFKYFPPPTGDLVIGVSQSGETADTLAALKIARMHSTHTLAITNVLGSSITRVADQTVFMRAGPEISVAATKSFTAQLAVFLHLINLYRGGALSESLEGGRKAMEEALLADLHEAVRICRPASEIFYVGRGPYFALSLEGALKMKEVSYIHAEGFAAGEIKHGPFALLSDESPVVALCLPGQTYNVMMSNIREMKARGTPMIIIGEQKDPELPEIADVYVPLPRADPIGHILSAGVILQLLAYYTADALGRDIDRPRNLAKSVTVE